MIVGDLCGDPNDDPSALPKPFTFWSGSYEPQRVTVSYDPPHSAQWGK
jgi:hypothetical protein